MEELRDISEPATSWVDNIFQPGYISILVFMVLVLLIFIRNRTNIKNKTKKLLLREIKKKKLINPSQCNAVLLCYFKKTGSITDEYNHRDTWRRFIISKNPGFEPAFANHLAFHYKNNETIDNNRLKIMLYNYIKTIK